jgi:hypothetical protein
MSVFPRFEVLATFLVVAGAARAESGVGVEGSVKGQVKVATHHEPPGCDGARECERAAAVFTPFVLRVGTWGLRGTTRDYDPTTVTVGIEPDLTMRIGHATVRNRVNAHIGGGESGFEWDVGGVWMLGGRLSSASGAPFARVGIDTGFAGNSDFYHSHFEAPRFELGYQLLRIDDVFLEVAARGGLMLAGRHRVFDRTRDIGTSLDAGGLLTLQLSFMRLQAEALRIFEARNEPKTPLDRGQAQLCAILGRHLEFCANGSVDRAEVSTAAGGEETRASYLGLSLGVGEAGIFEHAPGAMSSASSGRAHSRSATATLEVPESQ